MPSLLGEATDELAFIFDAKEIVSAADMILAPKLPTKEDIQAALPPDGKARSILFSNLEGALSRYSYKTDITPDLMGVLSYVDNSLNMFQAPGPSNLAMGNYGDIFGQVSSVENISAVLVETALVSLSRRDYRPIEMFFNSIPSIELSRAMPFLRISIITGRNPVGAANAVQTMNIVKFLQGANPVVPGGINYALVGAGPLQSVGLPVMSFGTDRDVVMGGVGMEIFTSPQTLVNMAENKSAFQRSVDVIDKTRPFMSIKGIDIDLHSANAALLSYKTARLNLILHDRSRLTEIADLVNPSFFGNTEILIEYGWSHPEGRHIGSTNTYGKFFNGCRKKEKYGVNNAKYSFTKEGEVDITLHLNLIGGKSAEITSIVEDIIQDPQKQVEKLAQAINRIHSELMITIGKQSSELGDILGVQNISSKSDTDAVSEIPDNIIALVETILQQPNTGPPHLPSAKTHWSVVQAEAVSLSALLKAYYKGGDLTAVDDREAHNLQKASIAEAINFKMSLIKKSTTSDAPAPTGDPFYRKAKTVAGAIPSLSDATATVNDGAALGYVSLGKLLSIFVGLPLSKTGKFSEIQFVFYPFNKRAGALGITKDDEQPTNIASFMINVDEFQQALTRVATARKNLGMTTAEFLHFIANNFVDDFTNEAYGLKLGENLAKSSIDAEGSIAVETVKDNDKLLSSQIERALQEMGSPDGTFKVPVLGFQIETLPARGPSVGPINLRDDNSTILRIHVHDQALTPYDNQISSIASLGGKFKRIVQDKDADNLTSTIRGEDFNQKAREAGLMMNIPTSDGVSEVVNGSVEHVKRLIRSTMPSIRYGTQSTMIIDSSLSTTFNSNLSTVMMLRAGDSASVLSPSGRQPSGLPLRTLPARLSLTTVGCPILEYGQQIFVDFGTGTTVDNVYTVSRVTHRIEQGRFFTTADLYVTDAWGKYESLMSNIDMISSIASMPSVELNIETPGSS